MNFYEHHIGDYDEATSHLTACEDGIYSRLLRKYYATEKALIADVSKLQRLVRAKTREEKQAVADMLEEFFYLEGDGWHQKKCDEVIAAYQAGEPERALKKSNEDIRMRRHREERAALFKSLTDAGQHAPWNIGMHDLRELVKRLGTKPETAAGTSQKPLPATYADTQPATAPATPATATHYPLTTTHLPLPTYQNEGVLHPPSDPPVATPPAEPPPIAPLADPPAPPGKPAKAKAGAPPPSSLTWIAYSAAYLTRYGVEPVRNAMVNGQIANVITRIGAAEAPEVAAFFVGHKNVLYVRAMHPVNLLVRDCEKLRTEWATNRQVTHAEAVQADKTQSNFNAFAPMLAEAKAKEAVHAEH